MCCLLERLCGSAQLYVAAARYGGVNGAAVVELHTDLAAASHLGTGLANLRQRGFDIATARYGGTDWATMWAMEISPLPMIHIHNDWVFIAPSQRTDPLPFMRIPVR